MYWARRSTTAAWPRNYEAFSHAACVVMKIAPRASYMDFQRVMAALSPLQILTARLSTATAQLASDVIWQTCVSPARDVDVAGVYVVLQSLPHGMLPIHFVSVTRGALRAISLVVRPRPVRPGNDTLIVGINIIECWYFSLVLQFAVHHVSVRALSRRGIRGVFSRCFRAVIGVLLADRETGVPRLRVGYYTATLLEAVFRRVAAERTRARPWLLELCAVFRHIAKCPDRLGMDTAYCVVLPLFAALSSVLEVGKRDECDRVLIAVPEVFVRACVREFVHARGPPAVELARVRTMMRAWGDRRDVEGEAWWREAFERLEARL